MEYVVVSVIKRCKKNTRYLVEGPTGEYYSVKVSTEMIFSLSTVTQFLSVSDINIVAVVAH